MAWPQDNLDVTVELLLGGVWTDITSYVRVEQGITFTRGEQDEAAAIEPGDLQLTLDNRDGRFTPTYPEGAYYGDIARNTPIRVTVTHSLTDYRRFWGEVAYWPADWDPTGTDIWTNVTASGVTRRLNQQSTAALSLMTSATPDTIGSDLLAYWPLEDAVNSRQLASVGPRARPMSKEQGGTLAAVDVFESSDPLPQLRTAEYTGRVPYSSPSGTLSVAFLFYMPDDLGSNNAIMRVNTTGTIGRVDVTYVSGAGGDLRLRAYDGDGVSLFDTGSLDTNIDGDPCIVTATWVENAGDVDYTLQVAVIDDDDVTEHTGTWSTTDFGRPYKVIVNEQGGMDDATVGHVMVSEAAIDLSTSDITSVARAWRGESTTERLTRIIGTEQSLSFATTTATDQESYMGAQTSQAPVDSIAEAVAVEAGLLVERRDALGYRFYERAALYNLTAQVTLDYDAQELAAVPIPVDDDRLTANDVEVSRQDGSSVRVELESGALSTADVGRYSKTYTLALRDDGQLRDHAGWRLGLGTFDASRFPSITVATHRDPIASTGQLAAVLGVDIGDRVKITDPPAWLPPDDIDCLVVGISETIDNIAHTVEFHTRPYGPYRVGVYDSATLGLLAADGATLNEDLTTAETGVDVDYGTIQFTEEAGDLNFDIMIGGEQMTVTAVGAPSANVQTLTVTRSVNGVVKTHSTGDAVQLFQPTRYAL